MILSIGLLSLTLICILGLGFLVFIKNPQNIVNRIFLLVCALLSGWIACGIVMEYQVNKGINPLFTSRISMLIVSIFYLSFIYLSWFFPLQETNKKHKMLFIAFYVLALISAFMALNGLYIKDIRIVNKTVVRIFSPGIIILVLYSFATATFGFYNLLVKYVNTKTALYKNQLKYVFAGVVIGFFLALTFSLFLPILGYNEMFYIGQTGPLFFVIFTTYAIVKHHLMDIEIVIRKGIIYSILVAAITGIYVVLAITVGHYLQGITGYGTLFITLISALIIVAGYNPLETFIENATDKFFFKGKYDYQKTLKNLSREISSIVDIDRLLSLIIGTITGTMRVSRVSIYLMDEKERWEEAELGENGAISFEEAEMDDILINQLTEGKEIISIDEIEHRINTQKLSAEEREELLRIQNILKKMNSKICVPFIGKKGLTGVLNLGDKLSEDIYTLQDLELLSILASQVSIALENARLHHQLERAERLAALGKLASGLAHEIRNPITSIKAFFQILNSNEDEEDKREIAELALQEIVRIEGLLENLLSFARPRPLEYSLIDIREVLDETLAIIKPESTSENIRIIRNYCDSIPNIHADEKQLKQVFMNLIFNALQAMPDGGELGIDLFHDKEKDIVKIKFADSGCGIDRKHLSKLFDPFFTTKAQGTGLGLSISQRIIENHNGRITIESEKGKGTQVHITLPAGRPAVAQKLF